MARQLRTIPDPRIRDFLLQNLLPDEDPRVRAAALEGIAEVETALAARDPGVPQPTDPETVPAILARLSSPDVHERAAAARALGRLGAGLDGLRRAYREDSAPEPDFRLAALRAVLRAARPEAARAEFAREALADAAWPVRREAHRFLRGIGETPEPPAPAPSLEISAYEALLRPPFTPIGWIETEHGVIEIELFVADAPRTVSRFIELARDGFYDGLGFHRVVPNFVVQAGDPRGDSSGGPGYTVRCEINERLYRRGSIGMALDGKDTGGSQFFITLLPQPHLGGRYTVFGQVQKGFAALDRIGPGDRIRSIRIWDGVIPPR